MRLHRIKLAIVEEVVVPAVFFKFENKLFLYKYSFSFGKYRISLGAISH